MRGDWRGADLADVVRAQLGPYEGRFEAGGPSLHLKPDAAHYVGMALHELATNAAKYGALSNHKGTVSIAWQCLRPTARRATGQAPWLRQMDLRSSAPQSFANAREKLAPRLAGTPSSFLRLPVR